MSDEKTKRMLRVYEQQSSPIMFLSGLFQTPMENFHASEEVEIDIVRGEEEVSIVIQDLSTGYRFNSTDIYTNKSFKPPIHKEAIAINAFDLIKRTPGNDPFADVDFRANAIMRLMTGMRKVEQKIRRAIELQASQVLQTGTVTLIDSGGTALYTIDYQPKATHFPTAGTAWNAAGGDPLGDIDALAEIIRNDGLMNPDQLIMGSGAFEAAIKNSDFVARFDARRIDLGTIAPMEMRGNGGTYRGTVEIGNYRYDIWTYGGRYKHPSTGTVTQFVGPEYCIVRASGGRLDGTYGAIPNIGTALGQQPLNLLPEMPGRLPMPGAGMDMFVNVWLTNDGEQLFGGVGARPLLIPTAIDTYGCIDSGI